MTPSTMSKRLENCIQRLAHDVLQEVAGLSEDEKNIHYLCRSIEHLVQLYAEDARLPQKRLAHQRLNRHLERLRRNRSDDPGHRTVAARSSFLAPVAFPAIGCTERKRRPAFR